MELAMTRVRAFHLLLSLYQRKWQSHHQPTRLLTGHDFRLIKFLSGRLTTATTVFVGNISESCNDNLIRHLLQVVGRVINWRRVQGANAKLESFGFVEYADQEDALRALRLVNGLQVGDKQLITKVDDKTRINLDRYEQEQREYVKSLLKAGDLNESQTISQSRQVEDAKIVEELKQLLKGHIVFNKFSYQGQG
ncbi:RNA-binding protein 25 [Thelohanellus kitauei]|uniref:RNA-binding protein 25 n=1 Tax=Thelohanellus kitauei TaxID=669202 RepID=A0A0C2IZE3_THEKT|nr:RNA-binding protein 25 [Thelohanellus kitauei]